MATGSKKHPCPDCRVCQWCTDTRCATCLGVAVRPPKLSMAEQIALYERLNKEAREKKCGGCSKPGADCDDCEEENETL